MKKYLLSAVILFPAMLQAQSTITSDLVEGGRTLVELIKVLKPLRLANTAPLPNVIDSCSLKKLADISFRNKMNRTVVVSLYYRNGMIYETQPLLVKLAPASQENLYEIRSGIYKYRIETDSSGQRTVIHEGDLKLQSCDRPVKDIRG